MRDNALVNFTGLEGHSMPIDLNIEHCIKFLKVCTQIIHSLILTLIIAIAIFHSQGCLRNMGSSWRHFCDCQPSSRCQKASWTCAGNCLSWYHSYIPR
jgi:hypothetical protein